MKNKWKVICYPGRSGEKVYKVYRLLNPDHDDYIWNREHLPGAYYSHDRAQMMANRANRRPITTEDLDADL